MTGPATIPPSELLANLRQNTSDKVLALASHAALPVVVDAGFVNLLRVNFFLDPPDELPFEAEADLLLSPLCREIGDELYELDPAVRNLLLIMLQTRYGAERVRQVALLLEQYTQSTPTWTAQPELEQAQQLTALSFVDPARAQAWLDDAQTGAKVERLSHDWYIAMRARLAARPTATAAQDELATAIAALDDNNARIRLGAVNTLAVLSELPGTDLTQVIDALAQMLRSRANSHVERTGRDVQAALTLIGTLPLGQQANLSGIQLYRSDLRDLNFRDCLLMNAGLYDCQADGAFLDRANLYSADLVNVTANEASLCRANLTEARLTRVSLRGANLTAARLDGAMLNHVDFSDADLTDVILPAATDYLVQRGVIFSEADLDESLTGSAASPEQILELQADALYEMAEGSEQIGNLDEAITSAEEALQRYATLADSYPAASDSASNYRSKRIITLLTLSKLCAERGNLQSAVERATEAVVRLRNYPVSQSTSLATALLNRGELYMRTGDVDSARRDIEEGVELYREFSGPAERSLYLADLARGLSLLTSLFTDDQSSILAATFDEAIALYREAGPKFNPGLAVTLLNQARWLLRLARLPEASAAAEQAIDLFQDEASLAACYQTLGDINALQASYDQAVSNYDAAIHHAQAAGNLQAEAIAQYRRGDSLRRLGHSDAALESLVAATEIFEAIRDAPWAAISLRTTGQLLTKAGRPAQAVVALRKALTHFQSVDDAPMSALTMSDLGHALLEADEPVTAVGILQDALGLIRRQVYPQAEATTLQRLGLALRRVGRLVEAVNALQDAMNIFNGIDDQESAEQALNLMQQILADAASATAPRPTSRPSSTSTQLTFYLVCDMSATMADGPVHAFYSSLTQLAHIADDQDARVLVTGYSDYPYSVPLSTLASLYTISGITAAGTANYEGVFNFLRTAIQGDAKILNIEQPLSYVPIIYFISGSPPLADNWDASWRKLVYTAETEPQPVILAFGLGDADEDFIRQIATFNAFMAEPDTDPAEAVRTIVSRLTTSLINSADGAPDLPTSLPGFRSIAPKFGIVGNK